MSDPDRVEMISRIGHQCSSTHSLTIHGYAYESSNLCVATDTEKVLEAGFSGLNTRAGDLLTVKFKYNTPTTSGAVAATRNANLMHIVLHSDHIIEIHDTSARVCD